MPSSIGCIKRMVRDRDEALSAVVSSAERSGCGLVCDFCSGSDSGATKAGLVPLTPGHEPLIR